MSEMVGFDGPIYMTHPTKAICPILLEDYRKITVDKKGETNFFTSQMIKDCMKKVVAVNLHQTVQVRWHVLAKNNPAYLNFSQELEGFLTCCMMHFIHTHPTFEEFCELLLQNVQRTSI